MLIRICGKDYEGRVFYNANVQGDVSAIFYGELDKEDVEEILDADSIGVLDNNGVLVGDYALIKWRRIELVDGGVQILWQTYVVGEVNTLKERIAALESDNSSLRQENEDLTDALLELAEIVGN